LAWRLLQYDGTVDSLLGSLGVKAEARVKRDLRKLELQGNELRGPHTDSLGHDLFELRTPHDGLAYRHIFMYRGSDIVILLSFVKKTQKTPKNELELAKKRKKVVSSGMVALEQVTIH